MASRNHWLGIGAAIAFFAAGDSAQAQFFVTAPSSQWTGFYVAANAGLSNQRHDTKMRLPDNASLDAGPAPYPTTSYWLQQDIPVVNAAGDMLTRLNKATFFPSVGYNYQLGSFLVGAEASYNFLTTEALATASGSYNSGGTYTLEQRATIDGLFRAGPRLGFVFDRVLIYGKGGFAAARLNYSGRLTDSFAHVETTAIERLAKGWFAGGGVEMQVSRALSLRFEVTYTDFKASTTGGTANQLSVNYFNTNYRFQETAATVGLVLRLN